jgi:anti-sigma regulatory factor (Ser/Thr protein kinase)
MVVCHFLTRRLDCDPVSVGAGRHFVSDALAAWGLSSGGSKAARADILLVTTELLSNAVKAASAPAVVLSVEGHRNRVDISVADDSPDPAVRLPTSIDAAGGRGLLIIDTLAEHWGQRGLGDGTKEVWAQVSIPAHSTLGVDCAHLPI